jgi:hypothetical protein
MLSRETIRWEGHPKSPQKKAIRLHNSTAESSGFDGASDACQGAAAEFLNTSPAAKPARRASQHTAAEKGVIQRQNDDRAKYGYAGAMNGGGLKPVASPPPKSVKTQPAVTAPTMPTRMSTTVPSPVVLTTLLAVSPSTNSNKMQAIIDIEYP